MNYLITIKFMGRRNEVERLIRVTAPDLTTAAMMGKDVCRGYFIGSGLPAEITAIRRDHGRAETTTDEQIRKELE